MSNSVSPEVLEVLNAAQITEQLVRFESMDRKTYVAINALLERFGAKWKSGKIKAHVFPKEVNPAEALDLIRSENLPPKINQNPLAFFSTQTPVCSRMFEKARSIDSTFPFCRILEPEAGEGAIADYVSQKVVALSDSGETGEHDLVLVEIDPKRCEILRGKGYEPIEDDFLSIRPGDYRQFDVILMNPPFTVNGDMDVYIRHIRHAYLFVRTGGVLVAIAPPEIDYAKRKVLNDFRSFVKRHGGWEPLPDGSFKESGTDVKTIMITLVRDGNQH
jgi:hypothetical protein